MNKPPYDIKKAWLQILELVLSMSKLFLLGAVMFLMYLLAGNSISSWWTLETVPVVSSTNSPIRGASWDPAAEVKNGIHTPTGLVYAEGFEWLRATCTACHSAKLVTQNRATRAGWLEMIRWMQASQGLWDLGDKEKPILDYLAKHYAPEDIGRRAALPVTEIEWYILDLD
ncbi:MAG: hypothetical protein AAFO03_23150 [Bacteroidota bacterium]